MMSPSNNNECRFKIYMFMSTESLVKSQLDLLQKATEEGKTSEP